MPRRPPRARTSSGTCRSSSSTPKASCSATSASCRCCSDRRASARSAASTGARSPARTSACPAPRPTSSPSATLLDLDFLEVDPSAIDFSAILLSDITPAVDSPLALELATNPAPPGTSLGLYAIGLLARADFPWEELPYGPGGIDAASFAPRPARHLHPPVHRDRVQPAGGDHHCDAAGGCRVRRRECALHRRHRSAVRGEPARSDRHHELRVQRHVREAR